MKLQLLAKIAKLYSAMAIKMVEFSSVGRRQRSMLGLDWSLQPVFWVSMSHVCSTEPFSWEIAVTWLWFFAFGLRHLPGHHCLCPSKKCSLADYWWSQVCYYSCPMHWMSWPCFWIDATNVCAVAGVGDSWCWLSHLASLTSYLRRSSPTVWKPKLSFWGFRLL